MSRYEDFINSLDSGLSENQGTYQKFFSEFLEKMGFSYPARSAVNLELLSKYFSTKELSLIIEAALGSSMPDMAINNLERISSVIPLEQFTTTCNNQSFRPILLNILGASPFLTNNIRRDPEAFSELFIEETIHESRSEAEMFDRLNSKIPAHIEYNQLFPILRKFKYHEILRIAARDLNGLASLEEVTLELSSLASASLKAAYRVTRNLLIQEHGKPLKENGEEAELTIIGMGKFGGRELNFSSDIDLIYFYSSDEGETDGIKDGKCNIIGKISLHTFFVKQAEMITKAISQVTEDGFVFRVDLGLRPDGNSGDMASSLRSAEVYYELWGQSWERAAMLKGRPVGGSIELGEKLLKALEPFIHRKYLDYNLIEDMMAMKKKIDASLVRELEGEYNIKLGHGGIREIEFFIQALQLVYAGKDERLRERNSIKALYLLWQTGIIKECDYNALVNAYRFLRTVEHRIQIVQERQTHNLPRKEEEFKALARRCGFNSPDAGNEFRQTLEKQRDNVSTIYGDLFLSRDEKLQEEVEPAIYHFFDQSADPDLIMDMLAERRFKNVETAYNNLLLLRDGPTNIKFTERARRTLEKIGPTLLQEIFKTSDPDLAMLNLEHFITSVGSRSIFYALLAENREVMEIIASLFGMSEFLAKILIGHPELLDTLVARTFATAIKKREIMEHELSGMMKMAKDFEAKLDILRRYRHEEFLRIGINDTYGKMGQTEIATQLTNLAETCLSAAVNIAKAELTRFGEPTYTSEKGEKHKADFAVIAMGKMGGRELNYHSDLDIIYIFDNQGYTDGEKEISNHEYFAKLGQKIIAVLTTLTREGYVYKLDTRLRPSGNAGPLVTSLETFKEYHKNEAAIWERQALTKARVVFGNNNLKNEIEKVIEQTVYGCSIDKSGAEEIYRLRMRIENEIARESDKNYNIKTGRGGMVDVEFIVQYLQLKCGHEQHSIRSTNTLIALKNISESGIINNEDAETLISGYKFLRKLENRLRIIHDYSINDLGGTREYLDKLALKLGYNPKLRHPGEALIKEYEETRETIRDIFEKQFPEAM
ncbi:MAG: bifunctional [glutamate--ammonia ligase]-adenylyl-L-tyrosine phosphorylase/[glutamate--ammonia-ligase] adenylyltransferase [Desulfuromonadales bacterium]|nr:bifunctional [glutamate--ammonia ligase]-adenylyl-L-tyrosine phosphorylase/[glutamate--ammonia-ligase] adenylyltransferase [Desulfuromonadales bacterium]